MNTTIKQILLSVLLLQTTCQILPTPTAGEQAETLATTLWNGTKNGICYVGSQALTGIEKAGKYCGSLALKGAQATGNFALEQAQARPYLAASIVAGAAFGAYYRKGIKRTIKSIDTTIKTHYKKAVATSSLTSLALGVLFHEEIKNGVTSAYSYVIDTASSYLPTQNNS